MPLYDQERRYYLNQVAAAGFDEKTPLHDLRKFFYTSKLNENVIHVLPGDDVQAAANAAAERLGVFLLSIYSSGTFALTITAVPPDGTLGYAYDWAGQKVRTYYFARTNVGVPSGAAWVNTSGGTTAAVASSLKTAAGTPEGNCSVLAGAALDGATLSGTLAQGQKFGWGGSASCFGITWSPGTFDRNEWVGNVDVGSYVVLCAPGVDRFTGLAPPNVHVVRYEDVVNTPTPATRFAWTAHPFERVERPVYTPYSAMLAIRVDDGSDAIMTASVGGVPMWRYCQSKGVPLTLCLSGHIGASGKLTVDNLRQLVREGGHEIAVHTYSHANPTSPADAVYQARGQKQEIESLEEFTEQPLGLVCRGFVQPGPVNLEPYMINTKANADSWYGRFLRETFGWSMNYLPGAGGWVYMGAAQPYPHHQVYNFDLTNDTSTSDIDNCLKAACSPGSRTVIVVHDYALNETGRERLKYLIDESVKRRDGEYDGSNFGYKLGIVTLDTLMNGVMQPVMFMPGHDPLYPNWPYVPGGTFDDGVLPRTWAAWNPYQIPADKSFPIWAICGNLANFSMSFVTNERANAPYPLNHALRIVGNATGAVWLVCRLALPVGSYAMRWMQRRSTSGTSMSVMPRVVYLREHAHAAPDDRALAATALPLAFDWTDETRCFYVDKNVVGVILVLEIGLRAEQDCWIDNWQIAPV